MRALVAGACCFLHLTVAELCTAAATRPSLTNRDMILTIGTNILLDGFLVTSILRYSWMSTEILRTLLFLACTLLLARAIAPYI